MADLAELGFVVRTDALKQAEQRLDGVTQAGDRTEKATGGVGRASEKMGQQIDRSLAPLRYMQGLLATIAAGAAANFISRQLEAADAIGKTADVTNLGTRSLQEYQYALTTLAKLTKGEVDDSLRRFNRRLGLAREAAGPAKAAFDDMFGGVERFDNTEQALDAVVARLAEVEDGATRAGLASLYFGDDAGPKLAAAIGKGTVAIEALKAEAHDLGLILEDDLIRNADQVRTEFAKASQVMGVQMMRAVNELSPLLLGLADGAVKVAQNMDVVMRVAGGVAVVLTARMVPGLLATTAGLNGATLAARAFSTTMAFFGGPIGLAITAVAASVYYLATRTTEADQAQQDYNAALEASERFLSAAEAGSEGLAESYREEAKAALDASRKTYELQRARLEAAKAELLKESADPLMDAFTAGSAGMTTGQAEQKRVQALQGVNGQLAEIDRRMAEIGQKEELLSKPVSDLADKTEQAAKASKELTDQYAQLEAKLLQQVALYGEASEAAKLRYEIEHGSLQGLNETQATRLEGLAAELDAKAALAEQEKELDALRKEIEQGRLDHMDPAERERERYAQQLLNLEIFREEELLKEEEYRQLALQAEANHQAALTEINKRELEKRARDEQQAQQTIQAMRMQTAMLAVGLIQTFAGESKKAAIAAIALEKAVGMASVWINTVRAASLAMAQLGVWGGPAAAAAIMAQGKLQMALIAATGLAQAAMVGSGGASLGSPGNPVQTAPSAAPAPTQEQPQQGAQITINVTGPVAGDMREFALMIGDTLKEEISGGDYVIIDGSSRQGRMLAGS